MGELAGDLSAPMPDPISDHPWLAAVYDALDADRRHLDAHVALADELGARRILDVGCGTTLRGIRHLLFPGGHLVVETRDPANTAWQPEWTLAASRRVTDVPGEGAVETWVEVTAVDGALVAVRHTWKSSSNAATLTSDSSLRFRGRVGSIGRIDPPREW